MLDLAVAGRDARRFGVSIPNEWTRPRS